MATINKENLNIKLNQFGLDDDGNLYADLDFNDSSLGGDFPYQVKILLANKDKYIIDDENIIETVADYYEPQTRDEFMDSINELNMLFSMKHNKVMYEWIQENLFQQAGQVTRIQSIDEEYNPEYGDCFTANGVYSYYVATNKVEEVPLTFHFDYDREKDELTFVSVESKDERVDRYSTEICDNFAKGFDELVDMNQLNELIEDREQSYNRNVYDR